MCILYLFLFASISLSLPQEEDDEITFKIPLLSYRGHTEKDVHIQLTPSLPCPLLSTPLLIPSLPQGAGILYGCPYTEGASI